MSPPCACIELSPRRYAAVVCPVRLSSWRAVAVGTNWVGRRPGSLVALHRLRRCFLASSDARCMRIGFAGSSRSPGVACHVLVEATSLLPRDAGLSATRQVLMARRPHVLRRPAMSPPSWSDPRSRSAGKIRRWHRPAPAFEASCVHLVRKRDAELVDPRHRGRLRRKNVPPGVRASRGGATEQSPCASGVRVCIRSRLDGASAASSASCTAHPAERNASVKAAAVPCASRGPPTVAALPGRPATACRFLRRASVDRVRTHVARRTTAPRRRRPAGTLASALHSATCVARTSGQADRGFEVVCRFRRRPRSSEPCRA